VATIADRVRQHLMNVALVRDPRVAGPLPPAWRQPANGVPAPGEGTAPEVGATVVVGIVRTDELVPGYLEGQFRDDIVDVVIRATTWPLVETFYANARRELIDKMGGTMAGMRIRNTRLWNGLAMIDSDAQGYTARFAVLVGTYAEDHG
jgi:hypothetical protein